MEDKRIESAIYQGREMASLGIIAEKLRCSVAWNNDTSTALYESIKRREDI